MHYGKKFEEMFEVFGMKIERSIEVQLLKLMEFD